MAELRRCPFCGAKAEGAVGANEARCSNATGCAMSAHWMPAEHWQSRAASEKAEAGVGAERDVLVEKIIHSVAHVVHVCPCGDERDVLKSNILFILNEHAPPRRVTDESDLLMIVEMKRGEWVQKQWSPHEEPGRFATEVARAVRDRCEGKT